MKPYFHYPCRIEKDTKLSLEEVIKRFSKETHPYIDMDEMLELVSIRGPIHEKRMKVFAEEVDISTTSEE